MIMTLMLSCIVCQSFIYLPVDGKKNSEDIRPNARVTSDMSNDQNDHVVSSVISE